MQESITSTTGASERRMNEGQYKLPALLALSEITASLSTNVDIEQLLERFLSTMIRLAGASAGAVRVLTADGKSLRLIGAIGLPDDLLECEQVVPLGCGVCGRAITDFSAQNAEEAVHACRNKSGSTFFVNQCTSFVAVPLVHKGRVLGVYNLFMSVGAPPIPVEVRQLFSSIGEHLGIALENVRLTQENMRISLMNERQVLWNEIHDSVAQTLAYMNIRMEMLRTAVSCGNAPSTEKYLGDLEDALKSAFSQLRGLLTQFHHWMDPRGLLPALQDLLDGTRKKTDAQINFINQIQTLNLTPNQEVQVFHIVQEALANIYKHAHARNILLDIRQIGDNYQFSVIDDGVGLDSDVPSGPGMHFGINIMHGRAAQLMGSVELSNRLGGGTQLVLKFPSRSAHKGLGS